ncbi:MAG: UDP-3-O-(3-hydroxymyristoyl)glucosamine N-acyltransferase [Burkholderiales bacterium]|nr:MAG: UDP-3-O-(3-hydroxymyristoyl)glucosamine N-acyltransferase [Burkholderiales bacterium]
MPVPVSVDAIAERLGGTVSGDGDRRIARLASLDAAGADAVSFLSGRRHARSARASGAAALIVSPALQDEAPEGAARILVDDPYVAYARLSQWFEALLAPVQGPASIDPGARVDTGARLGAGVAVGPGASIAAGARIGDGCRIGAGCAVGEGASIGAGSILHPNVVVYAGVTIGARAVVHAGTVIGADGFGFAPSRAGFVKIAQLGSVRIGDDVEIGANCAIDRGALDDTEIADGVKIDNLVQVGHNVRIGAHTVIAGCVGIAGSATIGARCMIGGGVGISGHIEICDGAIIGGFSLVERSVDEPGFYTGAWPLQPHVQWERTAATLKQLPRLRQRLRGLEARSGEPKDSE